MFVSHKHTEIKWPQKFLVGCILNFPRVLWSLPISQMLLCDFISIHVAMFYSILLWENYRLNYLRFFAKLNSRSMNFTPPDARGHYPMQLSPHVGVGGGGVDFWLLLFAAFSLVALISVTQILNSSQVVKQKVDASGYIVFKFVFSDCG